MSRLQSALVIALVAALPLVARAVPTVDGVASAGEWTNVYSDTTPTSDSSMSVLRVGVATDHAAGLLYLRVDFDAFDNNGSRSYFTLTYPSGAQNVIRFRRNNGNFNTNNLRNTPEVCGAGATSCVNLGGTGSAYKGLTQSYGGVDTSVNEFAIPYSRLRSDFAAGGYVFRLQFHTGGGNNYTSNNDSVAFGAGNVGEINFNATSNSATDAQLLSLRAEPLRSGGVILRWETGSELENAGFRLLRIGPKGRVPVTATLQPAMGTAGHGASYAVFDEAGRVGDRYVLEDVSERDVVTEHPAVAARFARLRVPALRHVVRTKAPRAAPLPLRLPSLVKAPRAQLTAAATTAVLGVREEGLYAIAPEALGAAGVNPSLVDSKSGKLTHEGRPIGVVTRGSERYFYAPRPTNGYDGIDRYVLEAGANAAPTRRVGAGREPALETVRSTATLRELNDYNFYREGDDAYAWTIVRPSARGLARLRLPSPTQEESEAVLRVDLHGGRDFVGTPDHRYELVLNGQVLAVASWDGKVAHTVEARAPSSLLAKDGENLLEVRALPGVHGSDYVYLHEVQVTYARTLVADADRLVFEAPAGAPILVRGFSSRELLLVDVTRPDAPVSLALSSKNLVTTHDGFALAFTDTGSGLRRYLATTTSAVRRPLVRASTRGSLRGRALRAELLIVTTPELAPALDGLVAARRAQGLSSEVISIAEIYDDFGDGHAGPDALRAFVRHALTNGRRAPRYLLLAGHGSMDPRGVLGFEDDREQLPLKFVRTSEYELRAPSDVWFALEGDRVGLAVGRIPARTPEELRIAIDKQLAEEREKKTSRSLFIADGFDGPATSRWEEESAWIGASLPEQERTTLRLRTETTPDAAVASILDGGVDLLVYTGHAWTSGWGSKRLLMRAATAAQLDNERRPFVVTSACWEGNVSDPRAPSVAASLLFNPTGGAAGAFAPTTVLRVHEHGPLVRKFIDGLAEGAPRIGDAVRLSQQAMLDFDRSKVFDAPSRRDAVLTYLLLGDPSARNPLLP